MVQDSGDPSLALGMTLWFCGHFFPFLTPQTSVILSGSEGSPSIILKIHLSSILMYSEFLFIYYTFPMLILSYK
jgi:hypothetical protein